MRSVPVINNNAGRFSHSARINVSARFLIGRVSYQRVTLNYRAGIQSRTVLTRTFHYLFLVFFLLRGKRKKTPMVCYSAQSVHSERSPVGRVHLYTWFYVTRSITRDEFNITVEF